MSAQRISQAEARRLRAENRRLARELAALRDRFGPADGQVHLCSFAPTGPAGELFSVIKTAQRLGFGVRASCINEGKVEFFAVPTKDVPS